MLHPHTTAEAVGVVGEGCGVGAIVNEQTRARDGGRAELCALGDGIGAPENQGAIDGDGAVGGEASGCSIVSDLDRAGADGRGAVVGIRAAEREGAAAVVLSERTRAADDARERLGIGAAVDQGGIVGNIYWSISK